MEPDTIYHSGSRTLIYLLIKHCWWLIGFAVGFGYLAFAMVFGNLQAGAAQFLADHPQWFVDTGMIAQWCALVSLGFLVIAFLRVSVQYRKYSFYIDEHAFHLRRGLFRVQEITIPYQQISNVHIEQPYHWRLFGLAQLDITISSSREALRIKKRREFLIPCIDKSRARALSHFLVKRAAGEDDEDDEFDDDEQDDGEDVSIEDNE